MSRNEKMDSRLDIAKENAGFDYARDAYVVGDSLSVGITTGVNVAKNSVSTGKQTQWMLDAIQKDIATLKSKKVMFLLGGTNDIFSNKSAEQIIANIDKIAEIARQNGLKVVVGTIPPFSENTKTVQNAMQKLKTNHAERSAVVRAVNSHIRAKYDYIDYHKMIEDPNRPNNIKPEFEWTSKSRDGIHMQGAYKMMQQAQRDKLKTLTSNAGSSLENLEKFPKNSSETQNIELQKTIHDLENSISQFQMIVGWVFQEQKMTPEQEGKMNDIIKNKQEILIEMKKILSDIQGTSSELEIKNRELLVYQRVSWNPEISSEVLDEIANLEKRILEVDEQQAIFLKSFRHLHNGIVLNDKLSPEEIENLRQMDVTTFLQMPRDKRLQAVTIGNISMQEVLSGNIKDVEINFSFNGRFNRQLYRAVTAGIIFPPEVREISSQGEKFFRTNLEWEFFSKKWQRLVIRDETKLSIDKIVPTAELQKNFVSNINASQYSNPVDLEIATEAERRWVSPDLALKLFQSDLSRISDEKMRNALMEDYFVDIERKKWFFYKNTNTPAVDENGKMSLAFLGYLSEGNNDTYKVIAEKMGYSANDIEANKSQTVARDYSGNINADKLMSLQITQEEINRIRSIRQFHPNSPDAILLFRIAANMAWISESWATNKNLHYILNAESQGGKVGILNYTIKNMGIDEFYKRANNSSSDNPIGARSTASWLGQLLLSNVDKYYPNGRKGIGDPINEAVGFMKYIEDRYGNPDVARQMYGRVGTYVHPTKGKQSKRFREWY